jgi:integrase
MPKRAITQLFLERVSPPKTGRVEFWDKHQPGLCLRVSATGAKSWATMYRVNGKLIRETLGTHAEIPKVDEARRRALSSLEKARGGVSPVAERRRAAERAATNTVAAAVAKYLAAGKNNKTDAPLSPKTAQEWRRIFEHDVLPRWDARPLAEITKADVLELVNDKAARRERRRRGATEGAAVQAAKVLTRLRTFFSWAIANDLVAADPTAGVRKPAKEAERDRYLSDNEIGAFWRGCDQLGMPFGPLFKLLLLTAQREVEVAGVRQSELGADVWEIPAARTKNRKPHTVHLSALALEILETVPRVDGRDLLFSRTGDTPASGFSKAKARLDNLMLSALRGDTGNDKLELAPWVLHDLRRTATTGMARLGIAPHVADRVLNHQAGTIKGVARVYNRFEYLAERQTALEAWGRYVESLIRPTPSNVSHFRAA